MPAAITKLHHARLGLCELVRIEGTDWIVATQSGVRFRFPPEKRAEFTEQVATPPLDAKPVVTPPVAPAAKPAETPKATPAVVKDAAKPATTPADAKATNDKDAKKVDPKAATPVAPAAATKTDAGKGAAVKSDAKTTEKPSDTKKQ